MQIQTTETADPSFRRNRNTLYIGAASVILAVVLGALAMLVHLREIANGRAALLTYVVVALLSPLAQNQ